MARIDPPLAGSIDSDPQYVIIKDMLSADMAKPPLSQEPLCLEEVDTALGGLSGRDAAGLPEQKQERQRQRWKQEVQPAEAHSEEVLRELLAQLQSASKEQELWSGVPKHSLLETSQPGGMAASKAFGRPGTQFGIAREGAGVGLGQGVAMVTANESPAEDDGGPGEAESDCSTTDTVTQEFRTHADNNAIINSGRDAAQGAPWVSYPPLGAPPPPYWMPVPEMVSSMPGWYQGLNIGSSAHHLGRCKPCAFLYKDDGCLSGAKCLYCHLCPPGEKQRRKRVMRAMQRNAGLKPAF